MNTVEIYEHKLSEVLERELNVQIEIEELSDKLNKAYATLKDVRREKQELKEDFEDEIRFRSNDERKD